MMFLLCTILQIFAFEIICNAQHIPHWVDNRNSIVHLFEWKFSDIANECENFLSENGYAGVQVSPVNENLIVSNRPWWERYQPISYKILTRSGTEEDFLNMTRRCNDAGIRIYVDIIINHMSGDSNSSQVGTAGSTATPSTHSYPAVPYNSSHFSSPICAIEPSDYLQNITAVRDCELVSLKDLNQTNEHVRDAIVNFCNHLIDLGVAGFRVDAAAHVWPRNLDIIYNRFKNLNTDFGFATYARPFIYQEVIDMGGTVISRDEYISLGVVTEFRHSLAIGSAFRSHTNLSSLEAWGPDHGFLESGDALVFVDNHDNQRGHSVGESEILTYKNKKQYIMATAFMLAYPYGVSRIMSSFAFDDSDAGPPQDSQGAILPPIVNNTCASGWVCEHRWKPISNMIGFKNVVQQTNVENWWSDGNQQIAFCRGNKGFVAFTNSGNFNQTLNTCLPEGIYCDVITGSAQKNSIEHCTGKEIVVGSNGIANIYISSNEEVGVLAIHTNNQIKIIANVNIIVVINIILRYF